MQNNGKQWLHVAEEDRGVLKVLMEQAEPFYGAICFHAQQAAEKYLKALIVHRGQNPRKTHDLLELCVECTTLTNGFRYSPGAAGELTATR